MLADCMTKAHTPDKHLAACMLLGVAKGELQDPLGMRMPPMVYHSRVFHGSTTQQIGYLHTKNRALEVQQSDIIL